MLRWVRNLFKSRDERLQEMEAKIHAALDKLYEEALDDLVRQHIDPKWVHFIHWKNGRPVEADRFKLDQYRYKEIQAAIDIYADDAKTAYRSFERLRRL